MIKAQLKTAVRAGLARGWSGYLWLLKILIPISFATVLLVWSGWLYTIDFLIQPAMGILCLPASAALPLIIGLFTGIYGAVAAMAAMALTLDQMTLIAVFLLISHNIVQESIVQGRSGLNAFAAGGFRILVSFAVTFAVARLMDVADPVALAGPAVVSAKDLALAPLLRQWGVDMIFLCIKIFAIIMTLMVALETMKAFNIIDHTVRIATPVFRILGLSRATGMLWLTAAVFGLSYGAAVIVEETKSKDFSREELTRLQLSIGINHAMIEDPALFLSLGIAPLWLWMPRLVAAIIAIYLYHLATFVRRVNAQRTCHKKLCDHR
jgi:hypothetical protein